MSGEPFTLDTNILVYALDGRAGYRHQIATRIVELAVQGDCLLTLQSISEFYAATTRKQIAAAAEVRAQAEDWLTIFRTVTASAGAVRTALSSAASGAASYWDALLVATAAEAGCRTILTEDLHDGAWMSGVQIINPFAGGDLSAKAVAVLTAF